MLIFSGIITILLSGFVTLVSINCLTLTRAYNQATAFTIAEAGIEYYRWHLAHASTDYQDGTGAPGPYTHNYYDKNGNLLGQFILEITPPPIGSSVVVIKSTGKLADDPTIQKIIEVKMGKPSFAKYAGVLDENVRFGEGTEVFGAIHSNGGIRFDGVAHNLVTSALTSYDDPDHTGANEFGVHTHVSPVDPLPPNPVPQRPDVFQAGREFPVPAVDFVGISQTLSQMCSSSISNGFHASSSGALGYEIVLKTDDTFDLYRVTALTTPPSGCTNYLSQDGWGTWSIQATSSLDTYPIPTNGLIFIEDNVWIRGQINTARLTIASARFPDNPSTRSSINITNDILYTNYDGQDVLALISQKNINIGMVSEDDLRIDAALMAQNGKVGRYYYQPPSWWQNRCSPYHQRSVITSYGMIASRQRYGFAYTDGTGYQTRNIFYNSDLLYAPPPSFPVTTDAYQIISWDEIK